MGSRFFIARETNFLDAARVSAVPSSLPASPSNNLCHQTLTDQQHDLLLDGIA